MISEETVVEVWQRMASMSEDEAQTVVLKMNKEQPAALAYLLAASKQKEYDSDEAEIIFYVGSVIWQIMKQSTQTLHEVPEEKIDQAEEDNEEFLGKLSSDSEGDFINAVTAMMKNYPEPEVLRYVVEAIMEESFDSDVPTIREKNVGLAFLNLKVILDAFIDSLE